MYLVNGILSSNCDCIQDYVDETLDADAIAAQGEAENVNWRDPEAVAKYSGKIDSKAKPDLPEEKAPDPAEAQEKPTESPTAQQARRGRVVSTKPTQDDIKSQPLPEIGVRKPEPPAKHLVKVFESESSPLSKQPLFGDPVTFLDGTTPVIGEIAGPDNGSGLLIKTEKRGTFRVPVSQVRNPKNFKNKPKGK